MSLCFTDFPSPLNANNNNTARPRNPLQREQIQKLSSTHFANSSISHEFPLDSPRKELQKAPHKASLPLKRNRAVADSFRGSVIMATAAPPAGEEGAILHEFTPPILLADKILKCSEEAVSSRQECVDLAKQVDKIYRMLQATVRLITTTTQPIYERPIRRIVADVSKNLDRTWNFVSKSRHSGFLRQVFSITTIADFRKVSSLLESSIGDMKWLLSIFDSDGTVGLPPIASNDPTLAYIWSNIATIQMGSVKNRIEAAYQLTLHTRGNERNQKIVVEEGGLPPLLKLLKDYSSPDSQIAAANVLINVASDSERVKSIVDISGVPIIVQVLNDSSIRVQIVVANLVSKMAELSALAQEEFARENVTKPLVTCLLIDMVLDDPKVQLGKTSFHSVVEKELAGKDSYSSLISTLILSSSHSDGSSRGGHYHQRKEKDVESSEIKLQLKVNCAEALWRLSRGSLTNSRKITETKGLLCLAKIIESEEGELQYNCLMTVMEVTAVAESKPDLRHAAFKITSPAPKAVLDQLSRIIQKESDPMLQIPAIKSIGSLARIFPAKESRIIELLVLHMKSMDLDVATEAVIALGKFACPENYNCVEHSKSIIQFDGVPPLMKLLKQNDPAQVPGLMLLCYLALSAGNSKALEQARALSALKGMARLVFTRSELHELYAKAIHHLTLYQAGAHHIHRVCKVLLNQRQVGYNPHRTPTAQVAPLIAQGSGRDRTLKDNFHLRKQPIASGSRGLHLQEGLGVFSISED